MFSQNTLLGTASLLGICILAYPQSALAFRYIYSGTSSTLLQYTDVYGNPSQQWFQTNSILEIKNPIQVYDPLTGVVTTENNPFNLSISPPSEQISSIGGISIFSAVETSSFSGGTFLQSFWSLQYSPENFAFAGLFTGSSAGNIANEPNLINAPYPLPYLDPISFPYPLAPQQTTLQARFSTDYNQLIVEIQGNTTDLAHPFYSYFQLNLAYAENTASSSASAQAVTVQSSPEPNTILSLLSLGLLGVLFKCQKQRT